MSSKTMKKDIPLEVIEKWLSDSDWRVRCAAMKACDGKDIPLEVIEKGLSDSDCDVRCAAMKACEGKDIPLEVIEKGLSDSDCDVRCAAMKACEGKDIPLEVIEKWLSDSDWRVRCAAQELYRKLGGNLPPLRTIEPPARVYKKCLAGVIVVAEIPKDAQVRGTFSGKCRASKAKIVEIIGDLCGEPVGVSIYDKSTLYYAGDEIEIENFDMGFDECSTGFHFFCTREQAENYEL